MKYLIVFTIIFLSTSLFSEESVKVKKKVSEVEKLRNIKRYYPKEYYGYDRSRGPHPLMTGVLFNYAPVVRVNEAIQPKDMQHPTEQEKGYLPKVKYPFKINIYSDKNMLHKNGSISFTKDPPPMNIVGIVKINGKIVCEHYSEALKTVPGNITGCQALSYIEPWMEVNIVHNNSYEILQKDGSSIFLSKKEMKPYVYKTVESDRDYLIDNKILTEKQLQQANNLFKKVKRDLYKISKEEFITKYDLSFKKMRNKQEIERIYTVGIGLTNNLLFFRDFKFDRGTGKGKHVGFKSSVSNKQYIYISFYFEKGKLVLRNFFGRS